MLLKRLFVWFWLSTGSVNAEPVFVSDGQFEAHWAKVRLLQQKYFVQQLASSSEAGSFESALLLVSKLISESPDRYSLEQAVKVISPFAESGRPEAQFLLSKLYLHPLIMDKGKSFVLLESLAAGDWVPAMLLLGELGAEHWLDRAVALGSPEAQYVMALKHFDSSEQAQGDDLLMLSAAQDYLPAQRLNASRFLQASNYAEAMMWLSRAAESGDQKALLELSILNMNGLGVTQNVTKALAIAEKALGSKRTALLHLQENSHSFSDNYPKRFELMRLLEKQLYEAYLARVKSAAAVLPPELIYRAGYLLKSGVIESDYAQAREFYLRAAVQGYLPAINSLGVLYEQGLGVKSDEVAAHSLYLLAAEQGYQKAMLNLADLYIARQQWEEAELWLAKVKPGSPRLARIKSRYRQLQSK